MLKLLPYQKDAVKQMHNMKLCILADEPGLGKTIQSLILIREKNYSRVLIICPATLKNNWAYETNKWIPEKTFQIVKTSKDIITDASIIIINYDICSKDTIFKQLKAISYDLLICDESHYLKNRKAKRTKAILDVKIGIFNDSSQRLMLTGTPFINSPADIFTVLRAHKRNNLKPYHTWFNFTRKFCGGHFDRFSNWVLGDPTNTELLSSIIKPYIIRRLKSDVLKDLPNKFYQQLTLASSVKSMKLVLKEDSLISAMNCADDYSCNFSEMATVRRELGIEKCEQCFLHVKDILENTSDKVILFAHHKIVISYMLDNFKDYNVTVIDGSTPMEQRFENVNKFQSDSQCRLIVCNITSGGVGITLTSASRVVFIELPWTPAEVHQAIDRCHRIGQKKKVLAQFLVFENSLDAKMISKILEKEAMISKLL